jgi:DNA-binding Lrp family transcriptional regulator
MNLTEKEAGLLVALQRGITLCDRPFAALAEAQGMSEEEVLAFIRQRLADGDARRFGAVFDARRLGYRSALCAMRIPAEELSRIVSSVTAEPGVTHCYERKPTLQPDRPCPNLWFTLAAPAHIFSQTLDALRTACAPYAIDELPALQRFKIDVVFDLRTRNRDERVEPRTKTDLNTRLVESVNEKQEAIVRLLQGDIPLNSRLFEAPATQLGLSEAELIEQLKAWQDRGVLRRIALLLRHREIGFTANGMCCWDVPAESIKEAGRRVAAFSEVTHCYERPPTAYFPFRLYAMIHTPSSEETLALYERITRETGLAQGELLLSSTEFKKTSMRFF